MLDGNDMAMVPILVPSDLSVVAWVGDVNRFRDSKNLISFVPDGVIKRDCRPNRPIMLSQTRTPAGIRFRSLNNCAISTQFLWIFGFLKAGAGKPLKRRGFLLCLSMCRLRRLPGGAVP